MKVTLRRGYNWETVAIDPNEAKGYNSEFVLELPYKDVMEILRVQVEMEQLQQRLMPLFKAAEEKAAEAAELKRVEKEGENLPV